MVVLNCRFLKKQQIYTYCGSHLIAINPCKHLPIYGDEIIPIYMNKNVTDIEPHIFAISEALYRSLVDTN
jgi:myosin heavy subunit